MNKDVLDTVLLQMARTLARVIAPAGPASMRIIERAGAKVMAVPCLYCVSYIIVSDDGRAAIVDVGSSTDIPVILKALGRLNLSPKDVQMLIPSHLHCDHIVGIDMLAKELGTSLGLGKIAFEHVRSGKRLRFPPHLSSLWHLFGGWPLAGAPVVRPKDIVRGYNFGLPWATNRFSAPVAQVLEDGHELPGFCGWTVLSTPGHSDESISLYHAEAGFLICGDTVRNFYGGEWNPLITDPCAYSLTRERLMALNIHTIFPGHGPILEGERVLLSLRTIPWYLP